MTAIHRPLPLDQVLLGDCCELMQQMPSESFDTAISDPPYGVMYLDKSGRSLAGDRELSWLKPAFAELYRVLKTDSASVVFYGWSKVDLFVAAWRAAGFRIAGHITFPKRYTSSSGLVRYQHENAFVLAKGSPRPPANLIGDVIEFQYSSNTYHPTQKPTSVLTPLIESFCPHGGVVIDPFAGSASTLVAARLVGRHAVGMEIDPKMHAIANARLARMRDLLLRSIVESDEANVFPLAA